MSGDLERAKRLARELRDLHGVANSLTDALLLLDKDGCVIACNPAAEPLLGIVWPRDRGLSAARHFGDGELGAWLRAGGMDEQDVASPVNAALRLQPTLMPYGKQRTLLLARDVSRVTRLEQMRRDFVANVSHELRTPLTVIHGYLELLEPQDVPVLASVLEEMRAQSQRMRQIVEDLLALSRLETQQHLPEERVAMAPLLESLRTEAQALSRDRHRIVLTTEARIDLRGSKQDLHSAFSNLVSNAVRYTPGGGTITIGWRHSSNGAEYFVADTGPGIPAQHLARLTERFYRVSTSRSRASGGTGLGLSIVKHVLTLHQAELHIKSKPGKGSTFSCQFGKARLLSATRA